MQFGLQIFSHFLQKCPGLGLHIFKNILMSLQEPRLPIANFDSKSFTYLRLTEEIYRESFSEQEHETLSPFLLTLHLKANQACMIHMWNSGSVSVTQLEKCALKFSFPGPKFIEQGKQSNGRSHPNLCHTFCLKINFSWHCWVFKSSVSHFSRLF